VIGREARATPIAPLLTTRQLRGEAAGQRLVEPDEVE
jgi:hypothetical protein